MAKFDFDQKQECKQGDQKIEILKEATADRKTNLVAASKFCSRSMNTPKFPFFNGFTL
jgi:hypothetical protein